MAKRQTPSRQSLTTMDRAQLAKIVQSYGKTANQRLRQIEQSGFKESSQAYAYIESEALSGKSYLSTTAAGEMKFNVNTRGQNRNQLLRAASNILSFLEAKTSTVSGTKAVFKHSYQQYTKKYGSDMSMEEYGAFWKSGIIQKYSEIYGSSNAVKLSQKTAGMSIDEIENVLRAGGLNENTDPNNAPSFERLQNTISGWSALSGDEYMEADDLFEWE